MSREGFTLVEVIIVLIVLSILAGIAVPRFSKMTEKGKMKEGETNLYALYMAEKMYKLDNPSTGYINCTGLSGASGCNTVLNLELVEKYFEDWQCVEDNPNNRFYCKTGRRSGRYRDCVMAISNHSFTFTSTCGVDYSSATFQPGDVGTCKCP